MPEIVESFPPDTLIISAQNGIDPEGEIAKYVSPDYVTRMVINFAGHLEENGTAIVNFFNPPNSFGQLTEKDHPVVGKITRALNSVDLTSEIVDTFTMKKKAWTKTILNASVMPVCGMMRLTLSEVMSCAVTRKITGELVHEGINVGNKVGFGFTDDMYDTCMYYLDLGGDHHPSMTKDLIEKKPTEIEFINGKILEHGLKYDDVSVQVTRIMVMFIMTQEVVNGTRKPDEFPDYIMNN
jgi:2-dehydropantoate 2-reductase